MVIGGIEGKNRQQEQIVDHRRFEEDTAAIEERDVSVLKENKIQN